MDLEGQPNCRDVGGITTSDERTVRSGRLLRSGDFAALGEDDVAQLGALGAGIAYDLRSAREAGEAPDRLPDGWRWVHLPIDEADGIRDLIIGRVSSGDFTAPPGDLMVESYRRIVSRWTSTLGALLRQLVAEPVPSVLHCTQGKDRTGVAVALVLSALGVDWADIEADYLRSNERRAAANEATMQMIEATLAERPGPPPDMSWIRRLLYVDARYLRAARDEWERGFGSTEGYLADGLGLADEDREQLRTRLLHAR